MVGIQYFFKSSILPVTISTSLSPFRFLLFVFDLVGEKDQIFCMV